MAIANTPTLPTDLKGMDIPLLSIGGKQDAAAPPELAQQIAALVKGGVYCLLDAGHLSATEQPLGFSEAVRGFLAAR
jgi:pimeloyl-ACP methyl ester carboxylesterase